MLHQCNPYVTSLSYVFENPPSAEFNIVIDPNRRPSGVHQGRVNLPAASEVAVIFAGEPEHKRDIVIKTRGGALRRISELHWSYDALQYPLLFPLGDDGYHVDIKHISGSKTVSCMHFYAHRLMVRGGVSHLHQCRDLFQQYLVDMFVKMESERLNYIRFHQKELRVDSYIHLMDAINNDAGLDQRSQLVILPSSFVGGPRYMHEKTQEAMTYVRIFGRPHLLVRFTCNPKWPERYRSAYIQDRQSRTGMTSLQESLIRRCPG